MLKMTNPRIDSNNPSVGFSCMDTPSPDYEAIRALMAHLGRRSTRAKRDAARANGAKGGRPRKHAQTAIAANPRAFPGPDHTKTATTQPGPVKAKPALPTLPTIGAQVASLHRD